MGFGETAFRDDPLVTLSVRIPHSQRERLQHHCRRHRIGISALIRQLLDQLERHHRPGSQDSSPRE